MNLRGETSTTFCSQENETILIYKQNDKRNTIQDKTVIPNENLPQQHSIAINGYLNYYVK